MSRPIVALLNAHNLKKNFSIIKKIVYPSNVWSVLKANAYGHGIDKIIKIIPETDGVALIELNKAIFLRHSNFKKPILLLEGFFDFNEIKLFEYYKLIPVIHSEWQIKALFKAKLFLPLDIYIKINSGMNRLGFNIENIYKIWKKLKSLQKIRKISFISHFAINKKKYIINFLQKIKKILNITKCEFSLANSSLILYQKKTYFNWVRPRNNFIWIFAYW